MGYSKRETPPDRVCEHEECGQIATHRAPLSPERLDDYYWFCVEHVRAYNKAWNYYKDMDAGMIARDQYNDLLGNRPTWSFGFSEHHKHFTDDFATNFSQEEFSEQARKDWHTADWRTGEENKQKPDEKTPIISAKTHYSLRKMQLSLPINLQELKKRYKTLVKQLHPDIHGHSEKNKKKLQEINLAYHDLKKWLQKSSASI